jgi:type VI secretion system protein ImpJ
MKPLSPVIWHEGMYLAQHHFQAQNRYLESSINFALSNLFFKSYGVAGLELDAEALQNGTVSLIHGRGVMPDGLAFHFPEGDPPPQAREIRDLFSPTQDSHIVLLTVPPYKPGHSNTSMPWDSDWQEARYLAETVQVHDETTGRDEKAVDVGRKNFQLTLDEEVHGDQVSLPLARVRRDGTGHFMYDSEYIAPCLQVGASPRLLELLRRMIEMLESKSDSIANERRGTRKSLSEYAAQEVASFWLSHSIHSSLAPLRHHLEAKRTRPEQLYMELSRLAGALCTFSLEAHPRSLPVYDHDKLEETFSELDRHIRANLDVIIPTNTVVVPLKQMQDYFYAAPVADKRCLGRSEWILGVRSNAGEAEIIGGVPRLLKLCSGKFIQELVKRGVPGLELKHLPSPPAAIAPRLGSHYFRVHKAGPAWEAILRSSDIGVYAPGALGDIELEVVIVLEGKQ